MKKITIQNKTLILILFFLICFCTTNAYALKKVRHGSQCRRNQEKVIEAIVKFEEANNNLLDYSKGFDYVAKELNDAGFLDEYLPLEDKENCKYRFEYKGNPDTLKDSKYFSDYYVLYCEYHGSADGRIKPSKEFEKFLRDSEIRFAIWYFFIYDPLPLFVLMFIGAVILTLIIIFKKKKKA
jgi:hypothetical protein